MTVSEMMHDRDFDGAILDAARPFLSAVRARLQLLGELVDKQHVIEEVHKWIDGIADPTRASQPIYALL